MTWEPIIGLEIHAQLLSNTKLFSGAATTFGAEPNTQACIIDLAMPGVLPVLNEAVIAMAIKFGLGINATINHQSVFARKNYFYPDLPKGYQISQHDLPIISDGYIDIYPPNNSSKRINIVRAHLEEDAGKSLHDAFDNYSGIDLNRAGNPLLEIVSAPELSSAKEAVIYLKAIHTLVRYLSICDGNMQEGSFRCDANVSVRPIGSKTLGTRTEIKNLNSFRFIERAINYEIKRQIAILENDGFISQETRLYDPQQDVTRTLRSKENATDYRYFPEPDLLPLLITTELIDAITAQMPELPTAKRYRLISEYDLSEYDADILITNPDLAAYFEAMIANGPGVTAKLAANWLLGDLLGALNKANLTINLSPITPNQLASLIRKIADGTISGKIAKTVFEIMWQQPDDADSIIANSGLTQVSDDQAIITTIDKILSANSDKVQQYLAGKEKLFAYFIGLVMKDSGGKINPQRLNSLLKQRLASWPL